MAATIDGINYESGGGEGGIKMGGVAAGAMDGQFTNQYYLPWELFAPPYDPTDSGVSGLTTSGYSVSGSSKKASWAAKDDIALDSAQVAIKQAEEDLAAARANPKKSEADRRQAEIKVEKAVQKVKDLEARKDAAAKGLDAPAAPQAPDLTTNYSDEQLSQLDAEAAVVEANRKRNAVYASIDATPEDRADADRALQRAKNALNKRSTSDSGSGTGAFTGEQYSQFFGELAGDFVTESLGDILGYYGADQMSPFAMAGLAVVTGVADMQKQQLEENAKIVNSAPPSTKEEIEGQLPATPGTPEWLERMTKGLLMPAPKLFDTGGEWESGTLGYNASGYKELVLNHDQREQVGRDFALLKSRASASVAVAPAGGSSDPFSGQRPIEITANGFDRREIAAGVRQAHLQDQFEGLSVRVQG